MKWTPIEEASDAFERPSWAIEKMVREGKLEKRVDQDGRVFVRFPPTPEELAIALAPLLPDEPVPVVATVEASVEERSIAEPSREELMLRAVFKLLEKQHEQLRELERLQREVPKLIAAPPPPPPPRARSGFVPLVFGIVFACLGVGGALYVQDAVDSERERTERALDHAEWLARELAGRPAPVFSGVVVLPAGFRR